jgi:hypothetical protein
MGKTGTPYVKINQKNVKKNTPVDPLPITPIKIPSPISPLPPTSKTSRPTSPDMNIEVSSSTKTICMDIIGMHNKNNDLIM